MSKSTDVRPVGATLRFLPVQTRIPLKFGPEVLTEVTCARVSLRVANKRGNTAEGWGETPLSVQWVWPSSLPYDNRLQSLVAFCVEVADLWASIRNPGHPIEIGHDFQQTILTGWLNGFNQRHRRGQEPM